MIIANVAVDRLSRVENATNFLLAGILYRYMRKLFSLPLVVQLVLPIIVVLGWLTVAAIGGPAFGKLSGIASNDQASFLPADADSTKVQTAQARFVRSTKIPAIVVVESPRPFTTQDLQRLAGLGAALQSTSGIAQGAGNLVGPIPARDGKAAEFIVQLSNAATIERAVADARTTVNRNIPSGTQGYVTGPAGLAADLFKAFSGIDGILIYVALIAVFVILLLVYRSIVLPFLVLLTAVFGLSAAGLVVYHVVTAGWLKLNGQSQGILSILAIGASTDYSLLIIARYREALQHHDKKWDAMKHALRAAAEPITASAATVVAGVLCLLFSELNSNKDLGPVAALGIIFSYVAAMTLLPALLLLFGRAAFWPSKPKWSAGSARQLASLRTGLEDRSGLWQRIPQAIARRPRATWLACLVVLLACAFAVPQFKANGITQSDAILGSSNAVDGQKALARHFPAGSGSPAVIIADAAKLPAVLAVAQATPGVSSVYPYTGTDPANMRPIIVDGNVMIQAILLVPADSDQARSTIMDLRSRVANIDTSALVGGISAIELDTNTAAQADLHKIIPLVLFVILIILMVLLRAILAPLLLIGSVILSFAATIGISALLFNYVFKFPGSDAAIPLFAFIFLVALGVDYNIFLMTRVREESAKLGTKSGILRGLSVTGSVITSAGIVLAATFAALGVIPILFLLQIAFIVAFGVLLDTIVVRSLLVPAIGYDIGKAIWWPSKLWRRKTEHSAS